MKRTIVVSVAGLSCLALVALAAPAKALMIAPQALPIRVSLADAIVVGKVTGFGDRMVPANAFPGDTRQYQIALVEVQEAPLGKVGKQVKVGFIPPMAVPGPGGPVGPGGGPAIRPFIRRFPQVNLTVGQEACLLLTKEPGKDFYTVPMYTDVINKKDNPNFAAQLAEVKTATRLLANPKAGLQSKDAEERLTTAAMLLNRYRTAKGPNPKTEPIDPAESKLILETLANADWAPAAGPGGPVRNWAMNPQGLFFRLGLTPADGWVQPKDFRELPTEAKKWLKANAGTYRIQRFVAGPAGPGGPNPGGPRILPAPIGPAIGAPAPVPPPASLPPPAR